MSIGRCSFPSLGTRAVLLTAGEEALGAARALLEEELAAIDRACSRFRDDSELARANTRAGEEVPVSELFADALGVALEAADRTGGLVDPTLGAQLRAAGYDRTFELVRARKGWSLQPVARPAGGWRSVELDRTRLMLRVPCGMELDLGATAKAWAADRAAQRIATETGEGVLVSLGGDLAVAGAVPPGGWPVLVTDDHASALDAPGQVVSMAAGGLATSSTSVRRWATDDGELHHIVDPRTGLPARTPWRTVSVAGWSCVEANVAATAAVVLAGRAPEWLEARGYPARLVGADGTVARTGGWPAEALAA
jgi:FAD:protein FMN transferase